MGWGTKTKNLSAESIRLMKILRFTSTFFSIYYFLLLLGYFGYGAWFPFSDLAIWQLVISLFVIGLFPCFIEWIKEKWVVTLVFSVLSAVGFLIGIYFSTQKFEVVGATILRPYIFFFILALMSLFNIIILVLEKLMRRKDSQ